MLYPNVCVVTVTYGDRAELCIETVSRSLTAGAARVIIVDNGSTDAAAESLNMLLTDSRIHIIRIDENSGSAVGFGVGVRQAAAVSELIWMLDDDNWVHSDSLEKLLSARSKLLKLVEVDKLVQASFRTASTRQRALAAGGAAGELYPPCGSFLNFDVANHFRQVVKRPKTPTIASLKRTELPYAPYGGLLIPRNVIEEVGAPDTTFVLYEDDVEWTLRMVEAGYKVQFCAESVVEDAQANWSAASMRRGAGGALRSKNYVRLYYSTRNRIVVDRRRAATPVLRFRYFVNKAVFLTHAFATTSGKKFVDARKTMMSAIRDGENGDMSLAPALAEIGMADSVQRPLTTTKQ